MTAQTLKGTSGWRKLRRELDASCAEGRSKTWPSKKLHRIPIENGRCPEKRTVLKQSSTQTDAKAGRLRKKMHNKIGCQDCRLSRAGSENAEYR